MKKLVLFLLVGLISLGIVASASAEGLNLRDLFQEIDGIDSGLYLSLLDNKVNYSATVKAIDYKDFSLNVGYAGRAKETYDKFITTISYDMFALEDYISIPILDLIEFNPYVVGAYGRVESDTAEFDWGIGATIIKITWGAGE